MRRKRVLARICIGIVWGRAWTLHRASHAWLNSGARDSLQEPLELFLKSASDLEIEGSFRLEFYVPSIEVASEQGRSLPATAAGGAVRCTAGSRPSGNEHSFPPRRRPPALAAAPRPRTPKVPALDHHHFVQRMHQAWFEKPDNADHGAVRDLAVAEAARRAHDASHVAVVAGQFGQAVEVTLEALPEPGQHEHHRCMPRL